MIPNIITIYPPWFPVRTVRESDQIYPDGYGSKFKTWGTTDIYSQLLVFTIQWLGYPILIKFTQILTDYIMINHHFGTPGHPPCPRRLKASRLRAFPETHASRTLAVPWKKSRCGKTFFSQRVGGSWPKLAQDERRSLCCLTSSVGVSENEVINEVSNSKHPTDLSDKNQYSSASNCKLFECVWNNPKDVFSCPRMQSMFWMVCSSTLGFVVSCFLIGPYNKTIFPQTDVFLFYWYYLVSIKSFMTFVLLLVPGGRFWASFGKPCNSRHLNIR